MAGKKLGGLENAAKQKPIFGTGSGVPEPKPFTLPGAEETPPHTAKEQETTEPVKKTPERKPKQRRNKNAVKIDPDSDPNKRVSRTVVIRRKYVDMARRVARNDPDMSINLFTENAFEMYYKHLVKQRGEDFPAFDGELKKGVAPQL